MANCPLSIVHFQQRLPLVFDEQPTAFYNQSDFLRDEQEMELILIVIIGVLVLGVLGLLVWLIRSHTDSISKLTGQQSAIGIIQQQLDSLRTAQDTTRDVLNKTLLDSQANLNRNLQSSIDTLTRLNTQIGQVQNAAAQMQKVGDEVKRLQDILSSPKLRGQMGEWSLENLLAQILPKDSYRLQYAFRDNKIVDALIQLVNFSVPIDAKFPLPGFEKVVKAETEEEKTKLRRQFIKDVHSHIDKISGDYIRPAEGTLDFAIMYIPAENVYYETIVKYAGETQDILQYCFEKKVIPVSPNLLYAYLMTVAMGLHGLQIEKQAAEIRQNLGKLNASFADFGGTWEILGKHLRNAYTQYDEGQKKLDRFGMQLDQIQERTEEQK